MKECEDLRPIFCPKSIAVIGASRRPESVGQAIFRNILLNNYRGILYPVNPKAKGILGVKCYPSVKDIPEEIDLAVIIVPREVVPKVLEECGEKGVKGAVIISAGFKEVGGRGVQLEEQVKRIVRRHDISLVGPNCLGVINTDPEVSLNASFARSIPKRGNIAFLSQSGALCTAVLDYAQGTGFGFSKFISMGNKADVNEIDILHAFAEDPKTDVVLMYLEEVEDGKAFIKLAWDITGEIARRKPILAVKSGRTPPGAKAASSHTGSLSGSDEVYDAIFAQSGVLRVDSVEELFDCAVAFANQPLPQGRRAAIVTNAGGPGIMATDACIRYGLEMAALSPKTKAKMKKRLPAEAIVENPIDLIGDAQNDRYKIALRAVLADRKVDGVIVILTPQTMTDIEEIARVICQISTRATKPILACFMGVVDISKGVKILEEGAVPHYTFPESAARALGNMSQYADWTTRPRTAFKTFKVKKRKVRAIFKKAREEKRTHIPEAEAVEVLEAYGFPVVDYILATSVEECLKAAQKFGYPVVMKIASPDVIHKFDVGGVSVGLDDESSIRRAYREMMRSVKRKMPKASIWGVTIAEMVKGARETIIGMKRDPHFGPILMFGLGGIYVEALRDVTFRLAPIRELSAIRMIESIRAYRMLAGLRGQAPSDLDAIAECLLRLSQLVTDFGEIEELDVNPLMVLEEGKGAKVADARILLRP
ncbi:MAG: acyl-CoA synthetase [Planctomycetes bacterium DG_23]|nr:MAG: acyl-CoA synthetase [Planctomycetes bacterium DG_23]